MFGRDFVRAEGQAPVIHPTALIDASAHIDDDVEIGPFTVIGPDVHIGAGSVIFY